MFEKLLLAATITFSLNLFIGIGVQSVEQPTAGQPTTAPATTAQSTHRSVYIAKARYDRPFLRGLFQ